MPRHRAPGARGDVRLSPALETRWQALWRRLGARGDGAAEYAEIARRYGEPARHYHTLAHVAHCLAEFDLERETAARPDEAEAALWLHDVVYDPRSGDNEAASARLAERMLSDAGVPADACRRVAGLIRATAHLAAADRDAALVCDADLAILGASPARYHAYAAAIAAEYAWVPPAIFRERRAALLESLLERAPLYVTPGFRRRYETTARRNLGAELRELRR